MKTFNSWRKLCDHRALHEVDSLFNLTLRKLMDMAGQKTRGDCYFCSLLFPVDTVTKREIIGCCVLKEHFLETHTV